MNPRFNFGMELATAMTSALATVMDQMIHPETYANLRSYSATTEEQTAQDFPDSIESPVSVPLGVGFTQEQIDVQVFYGEPQPYMVVTAEEYPNDVLGTKFREVHALSVGSVVTSAEYDTKSGMLDVFVTPPPFTPGERVEVDFKSEKGETEAK